MDRGRILVVSLSKGLVGEGTANLLGALLVASLHEAALSRADIPEEGRRPFLLAVDEFQSVATDRFASALSEARKYGLGLVLSHQFLDQLLPEVRSAALGNAGSMLLFRMGGGDAAQFSLELGREWPASRLADLPSYHAVLCSTAEGGPPVARVILERGAHRVVQAVEAAAHVAGLDRDEDLEAAGEAQHGRESSRMRAAASGTASKPETRSPAGAAARFRFWSQEAKVW